MFLLEVCNLLIAMDDLNPVIEHIASTTIHGLCPKPVIDILIGVIDLDDAMTITGRESVCYQYVPDAGEPGRFFFRK